MKKILYSILSAFMVSTMASAQYLNVKLDDGTWRSFKTSSKTEVDFGAKKETDPTESEQTVTVNGHTVEVKLAENTPAIAVKLSLYVEDSSVKVKVYSAMNVALKCTRDDKVAVSEPVIFDGLQIFTISDITKDVTVTLEYASWDDDNIINGHPCVRLAGLYWATENVTGKGEGYTSIMMYEDDGYYYYQQDQSNALSAAKSWGEEDGHSWTLPSKEHWQRLIDNCTWTWYDSYSYKKNNVPGMLVEGKKENGEAGHSIFLPAAGVYDVDGGVSDKGNSGCYWSLESGSCLVFTIDKRDMGDYHRLNGLTVRPVAE